MFATTIKKEWWNKKMQQYEQKGYFYEYKRYNSYWDVRLSKIDTLPVDAVFLVGSVPHRASITRICHLSMYDIPTDISEFLMDDINARMSDMVWVLKCEKVIENKISKGEPQKLEGSLKHLHQEIIEHIHPYVTTKIEKVLK